MKKLLTLLFFSCVMFAALELNPRATPETYAAKGKNKDQKKENPNKKPKTIKIRYTKDGKKKDIKYYTDFKCDSKQYRKKKPGVSGKEGAKDTPTASRQADYPCLDPLEDAQDYAIRVIVQHYDLTTFDTQQLRLEPNTEYSKIKKWAQRSFLW